MKIYSDFHDYYDPVSRSFQDDLIYQRKETDVKLDAYTEDIFVYPGFTRGFFHSSDNGRIYLSPVTLLFCGKLYRIVETGLKYYYDLDSLTNDEKLKKPYQTFLLSLHDYFRDNGSEKYRDWAIKNKVVIAMNTTGEFYTLNPKLEPMGFYRIFDTYSAYQEISSFISTLSVNEEIFQVSDEAMLEAKGFDDWTFKRQKHQSKPRGKQ